MRIGIDCRLWNESGVGRYIRNLVKHLQVLDKKNEYILFVLNKDYEQLNSQFSNGNFHLRKADIRWHSIEEQINFPLLLNNQNLDLVHFPYFSVPFLYKRPFVVTIHDLILYDYSTGEASTLPLPLYKAKLLGYKFIISSAAKNSKKIIVPTNAVKEDILRNLKIASEKIVVTYEGIDETVSSIEYKELSMKKNTKYKILNTKYFLYVGNAYPHKNLERLLEAFQQFKIQNSKFKIPVQNSKLILVGKEDFFYKRLKEKVKKMDVGDSIQFFGEVSDWELKELYKNAKALVLPSLMEGFGLPALEAMSNNCQVLASNTPALKEVCQDAAIYFDPYDVDDLAKKMEDINSNNGYDYSENIKKGFQRSKMFSWKKMAEQTLKIYNQFI